MLSFEELLLLVRVRGRETLSVFRILESALKSTPVSALLTVSD
jgi:hypothetical protein